MRSLSVADLEWRERTVQIRAAARKGKTPQEIADLCRLPLATVERVLIPAQHSRLSDPAHLLQAHREAPGLAPADVQLYWLGFLTAAGRICGQGALLTLVVTLGEDFQTRMESFMADLTTDPVRAELCHSSIVGWQVYIRDQGLCKALLPWGVPSDLQGGDPALLDDLPEEFAVPFLRGYADGNQPSGHSDDGRREDSFILYGTSSVLAGINAMVQKYWAVTGGVVTQRKGKAELQFSNPHACRTIRRRLNAYAPRLHARREGTTEGV